jgi:hypothetical protein
MKNILHTLTAVAFITLGSFSATFAQNTLGGHFGVVSPIAVFSGGSTTLIGSTPLGFPTGISIKPGGDFIFDLELVPFVEFVRAGNVSRVNTDLLFHPGIVYTGAGGGVGIGLRGAVELSGAVGFTALVNKGLFALGDNSKVFAELVLPVRFNGANSLVAVALHIGVGF